MVRNDMKMAGRQLTIVTEGAVSSDVDVLFLAIGNEIVLGEQRVGLNLIRSLSDSGIRAKYSRMV
jgi:hypothetical protein